MRKALELRVKLLGQGHPDMAISYNNLANNLMEQGKYAEAEQGFRKALDIARNVLGEEHPTTVLYYGNMVINLNTQGKHAEAEAGLRHVLEVNGAAAGGRSTRVRPGVTPTLPSICKIKASHEAEQSFRKALEVLRKVVGEDHPDTAVSWNNLALYPGPPEKAGRG